MSTRDLDEIWTARRRSATVRAFSDFRELSDIISLACVASSVDTDFRQSEPANPKCIDREQATLYVAVTGTLSRSKLSNGMPVRPPSSNSDLRDIGHVPVRSTDHRIDRSRPADGRAGLAIHYYSRICCTVAWKGQFGHRESKPM